MHLVIDMQGVQADLGCGRPCRDTFLLLNEIAKHREGMKVTLAVSNLFPNTIETIVAKFSQTLPSDQIRIWHAVAVARESDAHRSWQSAVTDRILGAFLLSLQPDAILATIPINGIGSICVPTGMSWANIPMAAIADFSGLAASIESGFDGPGTQENQDAHRSQFLAACFAIFAICDTAPASHLPARFGSKLWTISPAESELAAGAERIVGTVVEKTGRKSRQVSSQLSVESTAVFGPRAPRILAIKLDHLGDFLLAIPALSKLRARYPYAKLDAVVGSWNLDIAQKLNFFENVYCFDFFKRKSSASTAIDEKELSALLERLPPYDIAIDMRRQADSRFLLGRVDAKLRVGYETLDASADRLLDIALPIERDVAYKRTVLNQTPISLQILRLVDSLPPTINDYVRLPELVPPKIRQVGTVAVFPKAGTDVREWGSEKFVDLIRRLELSGLVSVVHVFFVSSNERAEFGILSSGKVELHVGLEFARLTEILSSMSLCIANNSGGIHLAAYLGVPVLGIYSGHETASEWGPQFHGGLVIHRNAHCSPCHLGRLRDCRNGNFCLGDITVNDVYTKAAEILAASSVENPERSTWGAEDIVRQLNVDSIVKALIADVTPHLSEANKDVLVQVANAIAENHPSYRVPPDADKFRLNKTFSHSSSAIEWVGFSGSENLFRWTDGHHATMLFELDLEGEIGGGARILLVFNTFGRQRIILKFNGVPIFDDLRMGRRLLLDLSVGNLSSGQNRLDFELPDAASPGNHDKRQLALAIRRFRVAGRGALAPGVRRHAERIKEFLIRWR